MALRFAYNGVAFGSEHGTRGLVGNPRMTVNYDRRRFAATGIIMTSDAGTPASELDTQWASIRDSMSAWSKNLGVTHGSRLALTDGVGNGTTTVTSAVGGFAATDIGLPILIGSTLTQITAVGSSNSITVAATIAVGTGIRIDLGYSQLRVRSGQEGLLLRPDVGKPGDKKDTEQSRYISFEVAWEHPASASEDVYRREASYAVTFDPMRKRVVTISGLYTGGSGTGALARYNAGIAAFVSTVFTAEGLTQNNYELTRETIRNTDDEDALLTFERVYQESWYTYVLNFEPTRKRSLTVSGEYVGGSSTARTRYNATVATDVSAAFTALGLTENNFELVVEHTNQKDSTDDVLEWSRTYRESWSSYSLSYGPERKRTLRIFGEYVGGNIDARARYNANIAALVTSVFTTLGLTEGNFELLPEETTNQDDSNSVLPFSRTYVEVFFAQSAAGLNHASVKQASVIFTRAPGAILGIDAQPVIRGTVTYTAIIDHDQTTDSGIRALWTNTLKPHLLDSFASHWGGGSIIVEAETVSPNVEASTIQATLEVILHNASRYIVSYELRHSQKWVSNDDWRKLHDGRHHTYTKSGPGASLFGSQNISVVTIGTPWSLPEARQAPPAPDAIVDPQAGGGGWEDLERQLVFAKEWHGIDIDGRGTKATFYNRVWTRNMLWVVRPGGGGAITVIADGPPDGGLSVVTGG